MLDKETVLDRIELDLESHTIGIRLATWIVEDGQRLVGSYHRCVLSEGDDLSQTPPLVRAVAKVFWPKKAKRPRGD